MRESELYCPLPLGTGCASIRMPLLVYSSLPERGRNGGIGTDLQQGTLTDLNRVLMQLLRWGTSPLWPTRTSLNLLSLQDTATRRIQNCRLTNFQNLRLEVQVLEHPCTLESPAGVRGGQAPRSLEHVWGSQQPNNIYTIFIVAQLAL